MKFKHFLGECDSKEWIGPKLHSGGHDYFLVVKVLNLLEVTGDKEFVGTVSVVVPALANLEKANAFSGSVPQTEEEQVGNIYEYGYRADVYSTVGENPLEVMHEMVQRANGVPGHFDELMERPLNQVGWTGWDFVGGKL